MKVTVLSKDVGEVKDVYRGDYKWTLEEGNEDYIKRELRDDGC